jgi:hypothetical protein
MLLDPCNTDDILFGAAIFCSAVVGTAIFYATHCVKRQTVIRFVKIPPGGLEISVGQPSVTRLGQEAEAEAEAETLQSFPDDPIISTDPHIMTSLLQQVQSPSPPEGLNVEEKEKEKEKEDESQPQPQPQLTKNSKKRMVSAMIAAIQSILSFTPVPTPTILNAMQSTYTSLTLTDIDTLLYQMLIRGLVRREGKRMPYQWALATPRHKHM